MLDNPYVKLALLAGVLYAVHKYGNAEMKIAAVSVAAGVALNQIPVVRDAATVRLVA